MSGERNYEPQTYEQAMFLVGNLEAENERLKAELETLRPEYKLCRKLLMAKTEELAALRAQEPVAWRRNRTVILADEWLAADTDGWIPLYAKPQPAIPSGFVLVPKEPVDD